MLWKRAGQTCLGSNPAPFHTCNGSLQSSVFTSIKGGPYGAFLHGYGLDEPAVTLLSLPFVELC